MDDIEPDLNLPVKTKLYLMIYQHTTHSSLSYDESTVENKGTENIHYIIISIRHFERKMFNSYLSSVISYDEISLW